MYEVIWMDEYGSPHIVRTPGDISWFKNWNSGVYPRIPLTVASGRDRRIHILYLTTEITFDTELWD